MFANREVPEPLLLALVKVFEIVPPMVDTNLDKGARKRRGQTYFGMSVGSFIIPAMKGLVNDEFEIRVKDPDPLAVFP